MKKGQVLSYAQVPRLWAWHQVFRDCYLNKKQNLIKNSLFIKSYKHDSMSTKVLMNELEYMNSTASRSGVDDNRIDEILEPLRENYVSVEVEQRDEDEYDSDYEYGSDILQFQSTHAIFNSRRFCRRRIVS